MEGKILFLLTALFVTEAVSEKDEVTAFKDAAFEKCKKELNVPEDAAQDIYNLKSLDGMKDHKCFLKCIQEEYKMLKEDGLMNEAIVIEAIKNEWKKPAIHEKIIPIAKDCIEKVTKGDEECLYSFEIMACFIEGLRKVDF